ncbi:hypothetical protein QTO34_003144 [Cnephaeus nilssonii]|uniref:CTCK domain-containing protein n=1 Tax=Cnephaeus nilssonii TaxID=3371016 RepID=A0AA40HQ72_CNENI|nr:hypothetical protein QTO34_003144 [Eptesicus nilssonii]
MPAEVCRVRELEEEVTYQGCTANVTVTRCEGVCASSASFNAYTNQVDTLCSCCHPLGYYEKQLVLPCPDPGAPGKQLVLTLQVFKRCTCGPWRCRDQGPAPLCLLGNWETNEALAPPRPSGATCQAELPPSAHQPHAEQRPWLAG